MPTRSLFAKPQVRITAIYTLVSLLWILLSDNLLYLLLVDDAMLATISAFKGVAFVLVTALILYLVLKFEFEQRYQLDEALQQLMEHTRQSQAKLNQSEQRFRKAIEEAPLPIVIFTEDGEILTLSRAWLEITGYEPEQLKTLDDWTQLAYGDDSRMVKAGIDRLFDLNHRIDEGEFTITCADSSQRIWDFSSTPLGTLADQRRVVISIAKDVSEYRRVHAELRDQRAMLRLFIEHAPAALAMFDQDMHYIAVSNRWLTDYHLPEDDLKGRSHYEVFPEITDEWKAYHQRTLKGEVLKSEEDRFLRSDGSVQWLRWELRPWHDGSGQIGGITVFSEDITSLVRYRNQLKRLSQRLVNMLDTERARIARELHDQIGQQLTGLGINLAVIGAQCGADHPATTVLNDSADLISNIIERLRLIISDLRPLVLDDIGLGAGLHWYSKTFTRRTGIPVELDIADDLSFSPRIDNIFYQIAQEALTNIAKHAQASHAWINFEIREDQLRMTIGDDGKGFDPDQPVSMENIDSWGLSIMQERIQSFAGGHLRIDSAPGKGTRIEVTVAL